MPDSADTTPPDLGVVSCLQAEGSVNSKRKIDYTVRTFAPEQWGQIDRFAAFFAASFPDAKHVERRAVSGVGNHFRKL